MRRALWFVPLLAFAALIAVTGGAGAQTARTAATDPNPCLEPIAANLLCPDLVMRRPFGLYAQRRGRRTVLRAGNSIDSVGDGPAELRGRRGPAGGS